MLFSFLQSPLPPPPPTPPHFPEVFRAGRLNYPWAKRERKEEGRGHEEARICLSSALSVTQHSRTIITATPHRPVLLTTRVLFFTLWIGNSREMKGRCRGGGEEKEEVNKGQGAGKESKQEPGSTDLLLGSRVRNTIQRQEGYMQRCRGRTDWAFSYRVSFLNACLKQKVKLFLAFKSSFFWTLFFLLRWF